jgi:hypothetical protein
MYRLGPDLARACGLCLLLVIGGLVFAPRAHALSRAQATRIALQTLKPAREKAAFVVVFGLSRPLGARQRVLEAGLPRAVRNSSARRGRPYVQRPARLGRPTWLFWEDLEYGAKFAHRSRLLLVDDRTGRIRADKILRWWPLVDGRAPAFIRRRGAGDTPYRIYTRLTGRFPFNSSRTPPPGSPPAARAARAGLQVTASQLPATAYKDDCLVHLVDVRQYQEDLDRVVTGFGARGIRVFAVPRSTPQSDPGGAELRRFVKQLSRICKDIIIYINGHGSEGIVTVGEKVVQKKDGSTEKRDADVRWADLKNILQDNPSTTFKFIVDSCFAGVIREKLELSGALKLPGAHILATSSGVSQPSYGNVILGSTFTNGLVAALPAADAQVAAEAAAGLPPGVTAGARLIEIAMRATVNTDWAQYLGLTKPKQVSNLPPPGTTAPPVTPPPTAEPTPTIGKIQAEFVEGVTYTQYSVTVTALPGRGIDYAWSLTPPADDPTCTKLVTLASPRYAQWQHSMADGCHHNTTQHNGVVRVVATVHWPEVQIDWTCTATYNGTLSGLGPEPGPCVASRAP